MEEVKEEVKEKHRGILLKKEAIRKANTYGPSGGGGFADKKKRKRVPFKINLAIIFIISDLKNCHRYLDGSFFEKVLP